MQHYLRSYLKLKLFSQGGEFYLTQCASKHLLSRIITSVISVCSTDTAFKSQACFFNYYYYYDNVLEMNSFCHLKLENNTAPLWLKIGQHYIKPTGELNSKCVLYNI